MAELRTCKKCNQSKSLNSFYIKESNRLDTSCKECVQLRRRGFKVYVAPVNLEGEIWKDVPEYEHLYQASNLGRIKSNSKQIKNAFGTTSLRKEIILKPKLDNMGYEYYRLCDDTHQKTFKGHRLVASAFIPNLQNKPCVNHLNGIKTDNRVENLEWVTYSENTLHAFDNNLMKNKKGFQSACSSLSEKEIKNIFDLKGLITQKKIASRFKVSTATISRVLNKKRYN